MTAEQVSTALELVGAACVVAAVVALTGVWGAVLLVGLVLVAAGWLVGGDR